jgi:hypothetical protein
MPTAASKNRAEAYAAYCQKHAKANEHQLEKSASSGTRSSAEEPPDSPYDCTEYARHYAHDHWGNWSEFWLFVSTGLLFIATAVLALFTFGIYLDAREKGRLELRAYLGIKEQFIRRIPNGQFQVVLTIQNSGKTPARNVRLTFEVETGDDHAPEGGFILADTRGQRPLAPNAEWVVRQVIWELRAEDIDLIARIGTNRVIYVWGRIEYQDIYGGAQHVNFRFVTREVSQENVIDGNGIVVAIRTGGWPLQPTDEGNNAS